MSASAELRRAADGGKNNWRTPKEVFDLFDAEWGFTLDGAADSENALCRRFYSEERDAFHQEPSGEVIWVNPPYGDLRRWIDLFIEWGHANQVLALVPSATDTGWFARAMRDCKAVIFLGATINEKGRDSTGRIQFIDPDTGLPAGGNTTGSVLFRFAPGPRVDPWIDFWEGRIWRSASDVYREGVK